VLEARKRKMEIRKIMNAKGMKENQVRFKFKAMLHHAISATTCNVVSD
jgi:hypothetical protein